MTNKAQQDLLNELKEYQTQQLDEIGDFTKAISRKVGQGVGAVKGAGQKVKGVAQRSVAALGNAYTQGQTGAQKKVAGQDYKAPAAKQTPAATGTQQQTPGKFSQAMSNIGRDLKGVAYDAVARDGYDYRQGVRSQSDPIKTPNAPGTPAQATATPAAGTPAARAQTGKRVKTGGRQKGGLSNTTSAQKQRDARAAKKGSAIGQGIDIAGANKGVANIKAKQADQTATKVPGQKAPVAQVDANKDGKDDKTGKPISKTAQNVGAKTGVQTAKIGGQKMDLNDPKMANMRAAIDKALGKGTTASIDKLDPPGKEKLKKALA